MKKRLSILLLATAAALFPAAASAQYIDGEAPAVTDTSGTVVLSLEDALKVALSENVSVKVADKEIEKAEYAKKGTYASLFPQVDATGSYQRTIKKQVMYMDIDSSAMGGMGTGGSDESGSDGSDGSDGTDSGDSGSSTSAAGFSVGRWNTFNAGVSASLPIVNAQLWKSIQISGDAVELAVEQARSSRLDMVTQVKQAYYAVLLAKEAFKVYKDVYENAVENFGLAEKKYNAGKASELEYTRAKANVAAAVPNVYSSESQVILALWQLKAVMGVDLDMDMDVAGSLDDYAAEMRYMSEDENSDLSGNTSLRQLAIQAEQLAKTVQMQKYAYLPTLAVSYSYSIYAMENDFKFSNYKWSPYSYAGLSLSIPIFSGGKRYNDVRQAKVNQAELDLQRVDTERQLKISVRQYLTSMETDMKSYYSALDAVELAQKAYDISTKSFNVGKSTLTDLNDARLTLTQAELSRSQAVYDYMVAKSNLEKTLGHDFLDDEGSVALDRLNTNSR